MSSPEDPSLEHIRSRDYYPKPDLVSDLEADMELPFPCLYGETGLYLGKTSDGTIALTNFRLVVCYYDSFVNVPLGLVEMIECRDIFLLHIYCKDSRVVRCAFATNKDCLLWYDRLSAALSAPKQLDKVFAFAFHAWLSDPDHEKGSETSLGSVSSDNMDTGVSYSFGREVQRMGFNLKTAWRITQINEKYEFCSTYPQYHIVPKSIQDDDLKSAAAFRTSRRIPSVVWRDRNSGAILARCSQPEVGWLGWRNTEDEKLIQALAAACAMDCDLPKENGVSNGHANGDVGREVAARKVLILDARSYTAAVANRAKGGGCECPEYYPNCEIQFMNLANIHSVRKSFQAVRALCLGGADQQNWFSTLETTRWLHHISGLMRAALVAVNAVDVDGTPVLVHCSDGWDRTPQIVALAELMLDPYYRTFEGFQALVEREWLDFGHKFADRCGHGVYCEDGNERCPVFLQFLDCVHQLLLQFPTAFQYNETFLVKLVQHTYSCLFGTFLCNSAFERDEAKLSRKTFSVWTLLKADNWKLKNYLYAGSPQVLRPLCNVSNVRLWDAVFMSNTAVLAETVTDDPAEPATEPPPLLSKTRSCDDIVASLEHTATLNRTSSDPSLTSETLHDTRRTGKELECVDRRLEVKADAIRFTNVDSEHDSVENSATESDSEPINERTDNDNPISNSDSTTTLKNGSLEYNGVVNGHHNGVDNVENGYDDKPRCDVLDRLESSTDTITDKSPSPATKLNGSVEEITKLVTTISTSTTDISDSHVRINLNEKFCFNGQSLKINDLTLHLATDDVKQSRSCQTERRTSSKNSTAGSDSASSSCPDTPAADVRISDSSLGSRAALTNLSRRLDVDGLTLDLDPVQVRLHSRQLEYQRRVEYLERQLKSAKMALFQYASQANGNSRLDGDFTDQCLLEETVDSELASLGQVSNPASDVSWENIDEKDANMTLWVPDHAVTHCAGCPVEFWTILVRKHHCRNCGRVFCGRCADYYTPIPQQQLMKPARVCRTCYDQLTSLQSTVFKDITDALIRASDG